jgi:malonate transporter and related proteins
MFVLMRFARSRPLGHSAIAALGAAASNSGFIGYPVAVLAIGDVAVIALALSMLVENFLIIPLGLALAEMSLHAGASLGAVLRKTVARLVRNPIVIAIVIGALISVLQPPLPGPLWTAIDMMARASAPAALFVIGGTLVGLKLDGLGSDIGWIVAAKLVAHPLAVLGAFMVFSDVDPALMAAGILLASVPMLSVYPIFGERFGLGGMCAAAMLGATVVAFLTVTMTIWLIVP